MSNVILLAPRVDQEAVSQLKTCSSLEGIESAVGMPSLTIGARYPKGSVFRSKSTCIHPYLIGPDIGLGISLFSLKGLTTESLKQATSLMQTAAAQLALECPSETLSEFLSSSSSPPPPQEFQSQLGMLEPGHFIELLNLEKQSAAPAVVDQKPFIPPALRDSPLLIVYSGSRGFGKSKSHCTPLITPEEMSSFLSHQQTAIEFAALNRRIVAKRFLKIVDGNLSFDNLAILLLDQVNSCVQKETFTVKDESGSGIATDFWVHRNGAVSIISHPPSSLPQHILMLGSYNSSSCIITPMLSTSNSLLSTNASLPSSCGRLLTRSKTFAKLREKYGKSSKAIDSVSKTRFGGTVINCSNNKNLLLEDASLGFRAEEEVLFELEKLAKLTHKLNPFWSAKY